MPKQNKTHPGQQKNLLSLSEVTKLLGISSATAIRWVREGRFIGVERVGNQWVFEANFKVKEDKRGLTKELYERLA